MLSRGQVVLNWSSGYNWDLDGQSFVANSTNRELEKVGERESGREGRRSAGGSVWQAFEPESFPADDVLFTALSPAIP